MVTIPPEIVTTLEAQFMFKNKSRINMICSFMNKPSTYVLAKPVNAFFFFKHLKESKNENDEIILPEAVQSYKGVDNNADTVIQSQTNLMMKWSGVDFGQTEYKELTKEVTKEVKEGDEVKKVTETVVTYKGQVNSEGKKHGFGKFFGDTCTVEGEFLNGTYNGWVFMKFTTGNIFDGEMKDGVRNGYGESTYANGDRYIGQFS